MSTYHTIDSLDEIQAKAKVVATSVVTVLSGLAVLVTSFANEIAAVAPEGWQDNVLGVGVTVTAWLTAAVAALRKVTPVPADQVGVLPPQPPTNAGGATWPPS